MNIKIIPEIGQWYRDEELGTSFEIVATDAEEGYIAVQFFSGEIEEYDLDSWQQLMLTTIPAPEDCSGPFEMSKEDYYFIDDEALHLEEWTNPLDRIKLDTDN